MPPPTTKATNLLDRSVLLDAVLAFLSAPRRLDFDLVLRMLALLPRVLQNARVMPAEAGVMEEITGKLASVMKSRLNGHFNV